MRGLVLLAILPPPLPVPATKGECVAGDIEHHVCSINSESDQLLYEGHYRIRGKNVQTDHGKERKLPEYSRAGQFRLSERYLPGLTHDTGFPYGGIAKAQRIAAKVLRNHTFRVSPDGMNPDDKQIDSTSVAADGSYRRLDTIVQIEKKVRKQ
jgi:hypothetical protein